MEPLTVLQYIQDLCLSEEKILVHRTFLLTEYIESITVQTFPDLILQLF